MDIKSLYREVRPNAIWDLIKWTVIGLLAMAGLLGTAIVQRWRGMPPDFLAILIVGAAWLVIVVLAYVLGAVWNRRIRAKDNQNNHPTESTTDRPLSIPTNKPLMVEVEQQHLNKIVQDLRTTQAKIDEYKPMIHFVERQRQYIFEWVHVTYEITECLLTGTRPYIEFKLLLQNFSLFAITALDINGSVQFDNQPITGSLKWTGMIDEIPPGHAQDCSFKLFLEDDSDLERIINTESTFEFRYLRIGVSIVGADHPKSRQYLQLLGSLDNSRIQAMYSEV